MKIKYIKISKKELVFTKGSNAELYKYIKFLPSKNLKRILKTYYGKIYN